MYAIVEISGKQFKVSESNVLKVPLQNAEPNDKLQFKNVMLLDNEGEVSVGTPFIKNALVTATVVEHGRDRKVIVFKKKRRKDYKVKRGHRQGFTMIRVESVTAGKTKATSVTAAAKKSEPKVAASEKKTVEE
ncbi:MAG: 50S ribosomal protein L21 [Candidatus Neomarinimicrobiota bacterium]|jgi:large subunit ribosomal protein L21|nr:50S ribosomal protein L21 [Candidatus Neomarinimicrobiota bacterium]MDD3966468.1 50S ribosomal protein L21 [Candidatus Neomarinimicrobiota bacterium]MDX9779482.1 50S ribosomal protein L21 [bacterium]